MKKRLSVGMAVLVATAAITARVPAANALEKSEGKLDLSVNSAADRSLCRQRGGEVERKDGREFCMHDNFYSCSDMYSNSETPYGYDYRSDTCKDATPCFFTTACCDELGLSDDCWELRTLRQYRDTYLSAAEGGPSDIAAYYEIAPRVLDGIAYEARRQELLIIYAFMILPCAILATLGLNRLARHVYSVWTRKLADRYHVVHV